MGGKQLTDSHSQPPTPPEHDLIDICGLRRDNVSLDCYDFQDEFFYIER